MNKVFPDQMIVVASIITNITITIPLPHAALAHAGTIPPGIFYA